MLGGREMTWPARISWVSGSIRRAASGKDQSSTVPLPLRGREQLLVGQVAVGWGACVAGFEPTPVEARPDRARLSGEDNPLARVTLVAFDRDALEVRD